MTEAEKNKKKLTNLIESEVPVRLNGNKIIERCFKK